MAQEFPEFSAIRNGIRPDIAPEYRNVVDLRTIAPQPDHQFQLQSLTVHRSHSIRRMQLLPCQSRWSDKAVQQVAQRKSWPYQPFRKLLRRYFLRSDSVGQGLHHKFLQPDLILRHFATHRRAWQLVGLNYRPTRVPFSDKVQFE